jgi:hypothetical protein
LLYGFDNIVLASEEFEGNSRSDIECNGGNPYSSNSTSSVIIFGADWNIESLNQRSWME